MDQKLFVFRFGDFEVAERDLRLTRAGEALALEPKALRILLFLLHNSGRLVTKDELLAAVWGDVAVEENSLTRAISLLRRVLGDDAHAPRYIETAAAFGYRFVCKVDAIGGAAEPAPPEPSKPKRPRTKWLLPGVAAATAAIVMVVWYIWALQPPRVTNYVKLTSDGHTKQLVGTDGTRLYFNRWNDQPPPIAQVAISGGDSVSIQVPLTNPSLLNVSPDGSALLVDSDEGGKQSLWSMQIPGGALRSIIKGEEPILTAAWSSNGQSVVYGTYSGDVYVIGSDGSNRRILLNRKKDYDPVWSPDGSRIRFVTSNRLWDVSPDGSGVHEVFKDWRPSAHFCCGRWSPDGNFYYFFEMDPHSLIQRLLGLQFWVSVERRTPFGRSQSEPKQLTSGPLRWTKPVLARDGKTIFARGVLLHGELVRMDSGSRSFKPWLGGISAEGVTFSPDGRSLAYVTFPEGILWRANRDGSNPVQLTSPPLNPMNPRWSPDGTQILFNDISVLTGMGRIYSIGSQGGVAKPMLPDSVKWEGGDASWSPDGRKILFDSFDFSSWKSTISILDLDSQKIEPVSGSEGLGSSRWSPDGRFLAAFDAASGAIKVFDLRAQKWSKLLEPATNQWFAYLTFSSNSRFIYFAQAGTEPAVSRVPVAGGRVERIADLTGFHFAGAVTIWFGLDPEDTPMLLRDTGSDEIYALTLEK